MNSPMEGRRGNPLCLPRAVPCLRRPVPAQAGGHAYFMGVARRSVQGRPYTVIVQGRPNNLRKVVNMCLTNERDSLS